MCVRKGHKENQNQVVVLVVFIRFINLKQIVFIMKNKEACARFMAHSYQIITQIHM